MKKQILLFSLLLSTLFSFGQDVTLIGYGTPATASGNFQGTVATGNYATKIILTSTFDYTGTTATARVQHCNDGSTWTNDSTLALYTFHSGYNENPWTVVTNNRYYRIVYTKGNATRGTIACIMNTSVAYGTLTSISITSSNGVSGTSSGGTTPALTYSLGAITPTTVNGNTIATGTGRLALSSYSLNVGANSTINGSSTGTNTGDQTTVSGNAGTATALETARTINGTSFNGTANITVTAAGSTLTGSSLASGITSSSLTSFGTSPALSGTPTAPSGGSGNQIATNTDISNAIAGVNPAVAVQAATTTTLAAYTYNNGASGIGAFITITTPAVLVIDGYTVTTTVPATRILIKNETGGNAPYNGVYYVSVVGSGIVSTVLIRALDYDQPSDINNTGAIPVVNGTLNALTSWLLTSSITTVGTDALTYSQFSLSPTATGTGLDVRATSPSISGAVLSGNTQLGTPTSGTLTNCTIPVGGITGAGTGVLTALAVNTGSAGALITYNGNAGTPSALVGTNISGTAASLTAGSVTTNANLTGAVTSSGNATSLGSFSSSNLSTAVTDETGSGLAVFATSPSLTTPTIASFTNATHNHTNAAGGGQIAISTGCSDYVATTTFTATVTGYSSGPTQNQMKYNKIADLVTVWFNYSGGTSNATTLTITNMPYTCSTLSWFFMGYEDNGTFATTMGSCSLSGTTLTFYPNCSGAGNFTASGAKGAYGVIQYHTP